MHILNTKHINTLTPSMYTYYPQNIHTYSIKHIDNTQNTHQKNGQRKGIGRHLNYKSPLTAAVHCSTKVHKKHTIFMQQNRHNTPSKHNRDNKTALATGWDGGDGEEKWRQKREECFL